MTVKTRKRLFRKLTPGNWDEHDTTADHIGRIDAHGAHPISEDEWARYFLSITLSDKVPQDVHDLFEVAQGAMCYGCRFYPLYTLGSEQLFRVLEAALHHRCEQLGAPAGANSFGRKLSWLRGKGLLNEDNPMRWDASRKLRNYGSHAQFQSIYSPDMAVTQLSQVAELINDLFS